MKIMARNSVIFLAMCSSVMGFAAVDKFSCETVKGDERTKLEVQEGKNKIALDEPAIRLKEQNGHKVGAFYYSKDDSLGLVIDDSTNTTYQASKLAPKFLTFLTLRDGTEIRCSSIPFKSK